MTKAEREALKAEFVVGDYRTIKEFCEKKGIAYNGTLRAIAGQEHWLKDKNEHSRQIQGRIIAEAQEKRIEEGIRDATKRQNDTLEATNKIREVAFRLMSRSNVTAKEINSLASALYRCNEIESNLLNYNKGSSADAKDRLSEVVSAIKGRINASDD
ncbi:MAG: hypothetical protein ACI4MZ_01260 [Christensenellales bacterium]